MQENLQHKGFETNLSADLNPERHFASTRMCRIEILSTWWLCVYLFCPKHFIVLADRKLHTCQNCLNLRIEGISQQTKKTRNEKVMQYGGGISSRSSEGTRLVTKTMPCIAYCLEPSAIGDQGCPGKLFSWIFICFHWYQEDLRLSGARKFAGLWHPLAGCGPEVLPL